MEPSCLLSHQLFNIAFYFTGVAVLVSLGRFNWLIRTALAFPVGVTTWGVGMTMCIIFPITLSGFNAGLCTLSLLIVFGIIYKPSFTGEYRKFIGAWPICVGLLFFFGALIIGITWFFYHHNYTYSSPDSWRYIFFGDMIAKIGTVPPEYTGYLDEFTIIIPLLTATGRFIGINFFPFTLFPAYGVSLIIVLAVVIWLKVSGDFKKTYNRWIIISLAVALCISTPVFIVHAFYVNEHMLAGINFLIVIAGIHEYTKDGQLKWLRLAGLCMGVLTLQRAEMLLFGFLPFCMLLRATQERRIALSYLLPFLYIAIGWEFYKKFSYMETPLLGRGALLYQGGLLMCYIAATCLIGNHSLKKIYRHAEYIVAAALAAILVFAIILSGEKTFADPVNALVMLAKVLFMQPGEKFCEWGLSWYFIFSVFLLDLLFVRTPHKGLRLLLINTFLIRILLYSFPGVFPGLSHLSSGSRLLMHFFPVFIMYAFMVVSYRFRLWIESKESDRSTKTPIHFCSKA
jgi:hypothetical protein